jgi:VanZ family protein
MVILLFSGDLGSGPHTISIIKWITSFLMTFSPEKLYLLHGWLRKGAHFFAYGVLSVLWWRALRFYLPGWSVASIAFALIFCLGVALLDEGHQTLLTTRTGDLGDIALDMAGAASLVVLASFCGRRKPKHHLEAKLQNASIKDKPDSNVSGTRWGDPGGLIDEANEAQIREKESLDRDAMTMERLAKMERQNRRLTFAIFISLTLLVIFILVQFMKDYRSNHVSLEGVAREKSLIKHPEKVTSPEKIVKLPEVPTPTPRETLKLQHPPPAGEKSRLEPTISRDSSSVGTLNQPEVFKDAVQKEIIPSKDRKGKGTLPPKPIVQIPKPRVKVPRPQVLMP